MDLPHVVPHEAVPHAAIASIFCVSTVKCQHSAVVKWYHFAVDRELHILKQCWANFRNGLSGHPVDFWNWICGTIRPRIELIQKRKVPTGTRSKTWWRLEHLWIVQRTCRPNRGHDEICDTFFNIMPGWNVAQMDDKHQNIGKNSGQLVIPLTMTVDYFGMTLILIELTLFSPVNPWEPRFGPITMILVLISITFWMEPAWTMSSLSIEDGECRLDTHGLSVGEWRCHPFVVHGLLITGGVRTIRRRYPDIVDAKSHDGLPAYVPGARKVYHPPRVALSCHPWGKKLQHQLWNLVKISHY